MKIIYFLFSFAFLSTVYAQDKEVQVVTTIKPLASLIENITGETPHILIRGNSSPHRFMLNPSDIRAINNSDMVIYIDDSFETPLPKILRSIENEENILTIGKSLSLPLLPVRNKHDHDHGHGHGHGHTSDLHFWLSPVYAKEISKIITDKLSDKFPGKRTYYQKNLQSLLDRLDSLHLDISNQLFSLDSYKFIVFHDAYGYFEKEYGLRSIASVTINPTENLSVNYIKSIRNTVKDHNVKCLFIEPQFPTKQLHLLGDDITYATIDPIGMDEDAGKDHYFKMMRSLANGFKGCLDKNKQT